MDYTPQRPLLNGEKHLQNQNIYGSILLGNNSSVIDVNRNVLYEPIIDPRSSEPTSPYNNNNIAGQLIYNDSNKLIGWWDGSQWRYPATAVAIKYSTPIRLVENTGVVPSSNPTTIDGISVNLNDRVLFANTTNKQFNGVYIKTSGGYVRAEDFDEVSEFPGALLISKEGNLYADKLWLCTTNDADLQTLNTDNIDWEYINVASYSFRHGVNVDANRVVDVDITANSGLEFNGADPNNQQLDVRLASGLNALTKGGGLKVNVDDVTIGINGSNKIYAKIGFKEVEILLQSLSTGQVTFTIDNTKDSEMNNFTNIVGVNCYGWEGDNRLAMNEQFMANAVVNNTSKVVTIKMDAIYLGTYKFVVYGYGS
jgi:hypothetical protein